VRYDHCLDEAEAFGEGGGEDVADCGDEPGYVSWLGEGIWELDVPGS
jgi:hypothetical protein